MDAPNTVIRVRNETDRGFEDRKGPLLSPLDALSGPSQAPKPAGRQGGARASAGAEGHVAPADGLRKRLVQTRVFCHAAVRCVVGGLFILTTAIGFHYFGYSCATGSSYQEERDRLGRSVIHVLTQEHVQYFLDFGTMLQVWRHQESPSTWDQDIDLGVLLLDSPADRRPATLGTPRTIHNRLRETRVVDGVSVAGVSNVALMCRLLKSKGLDARYFPVRQLIQVYTSPAQPAWAPHVDIWLYQVNPLDSAQLFLPPASCPCPTKRRALRSVFPIESVDSALFLGRRSLPMPREAKALLHQEYGPGIDESTPGVSECFDNLFLGRVFYWTEASGQPRE